MKKMDFLQKLPAIVCDRKGEKNVHFRAHYLFWPKTFLGPRQRKPGNTIKNSGSGGNCPKPKMTPFFLKKVFFDMGESLGFTTVFLKSCALLQPLFL